MMALSIGGWLVRFRTKRNNGYLSLLAFCTNRGSNKMHSGTGPVYEIMLKMRAVALSWTAGDLDAADDLVAKALKDALDSVSNTDRVDIEDWLMELLLQRHEETPASGPYSRVGTQTEQASLKTTGKG